jgi:ELKS/RAB6-interacting/CAST family protein 1
LRKEESAKYYALIEQYKLTQQQYQSLMETYEQQAHTVQDLQTQLQFAHNPHDDLQGNKNLQREKTILKKIINELEMRINTQKQTLNAKDETIKKLFQLIKSLNAKGSGSDLTMIKNDLLELDQLTNKYESIQQLKERLQEEERKNSHLQELIQQQQENNSIYNTLNNQKMNKVSNIYHYEHLAFV